MSNPSIPPQWKEVQTSAQSLGMHPQLLDVRTPEDVGRLVVYGVNYPDHYRRAASFVDRIFKGAPPVDLPIEQPTKFDLIVNMKTAQALGLTVPASLLVRSDQVIH